MTQREVFPDPTVVMIGAGAMGGVIAGALAQAGAALSIIDTDADHAAAINADGLRVAGLGVDTALSVATSTQPPEAGYADLAVIMTPAYATQAAADTARTILKPDGAAVSMQNGLGNQEVLVDTLGADRVFMGSTKVSADRPAPGCPRATRIDPSTVGEIDGRPRERTLWLADTLSRGGLPTEASENITGVLWSKFIHNCGINALSAITGLRMGEVTRTPGLGDLRWQIIEEALTVARAKRIRLADPDPIPRLKAHVWRKFTKPSMLQHVEQGRPIEIDAINGWLVREADALGLDVPANRMVTALARGRALAATRALHETPDYAALSADAEAEIARGETPWDRAAQQGDER
ncbi:MAG: 2-dehydropantoate 2-reductase [Pseudomonadota bacterium]